MALQLRRVVTGHDENGRAVVKIDEISKNQPSGRSGTVGLCGLDHGIFSRRQHRRGRRRTANVGTTLKNGTVFRVVEFAPGVSPRNHRTDSIDYAVVMSGEIDMELDDSVVHLKAGDVLVQRGTIHNWVNRGSEPCVIAFILIDAKPVEIGGKVLHAEG